MDAKEKKQIIIAFHRAFSGNDGEKVLKNLEGRCSIKHTPFRPGQPDTSAFNMGRQSVFMYIKQMMETDPDTIKDLPTEY